MDNHLITRRTAFPTTYRIAGTAAALLLALGLAAPTGAQALPAGTTAEQPALPHTLSGQVTQEPKDPPRPLRSPTLRADASAPEAHPSSSQIPRQEASPASGTTTEPDPETGAGHRFWSPGLVALSTLVAATLAGAGYLSVRSRRAKRSTKGNRT